MRLRSYLGLGISNFLLFFCVSCEQASFAASSSQQNAIEVQKSSFDSNFTVVPRYVAPPVPDLAPCEAGFEFYQGSCVETREIDALVKEARKEAADKVLHAESLDEQAAASAYLLEQQTIQVERSSAALDDIIKQIEIEIEQEKALKSRKSRSRGR